MNAFLDALLVDVGGTLVEEAARGTAVADLEVRLLPNVARDLAAIAERIPVAAVTNTASMTEADVRRLLATVSVDRHLAAVVTSADVGAAKPDPAPLLVALDRLGVHHRQRVLFVGDTVTDEEAARAAGVHFARVAADGLSATVDGWAAEQAERELAGVAEAVRPCDADAAAAARGLHLRLTKPAGALGALEALGVQLAAMSGECPPPLPSPAVVAVFAGDHGVVEEGVTPWPQEVTAQMVANFAAGGAAINVLARQSGARVLTVDVGVATALPPAPGVLSRTVRRGTANLRHGPAMTRRDALAALAVGIQVARSAVLDLGARCLVTGDMGIGNTTASAAVIAAFTGRPAGEVTGRGTGIDDATLALKTTVVAEAAERIRRRGRTAPLDVLAEVGGLEIAALAGFVLGGAANRVPVVLDGVISLAGALAACAIVPLARDWCIAGHRSVEPGAAAALHALGLEPLLDLRLRLGEGSGAALALPLVESAARILREMATFDSAGVSDKR